MPKRPPPSEPKTPRGRPVALPGPLGDLARAVGGTKALAERIGVGQRSLQRWATKPPPKSIRLLLAYLARDEGLSVAQQVELSNLNIRPKATRQRAKR